MVSISDCTTNTKMSEWYEKAFVSRRIYIADWLMEWMVAGDTPFFKRHGELITLERGDRKIVWKLTGKTNERGALEAVWPD
jgi:hypothetical protein